MSQSGNDARPKRSRPTIAALLQEALDTPFEPLDTKAPATRLPEQLRSTPAAPPVAHIDQSQHPHHHIQSQHITSPVRYTAEPERTEPDGMPIIRPGRSNSGVTGLLNKSRKASAAPASSSAVAAGSSSSSRQDEQTLSPKRQGKLPLQPSTRRPSDAQDMRDEVDNLRRRSGAGQDHHPDPAVSPSSKRESFDGVRIGGQAFSSLVASNPFQQESDPYKSLISHDPFQKEPRSEVQTRPNKPRMRHRSSSTSTLDTPPRHLQRTISSLIRQKDASQNQGSAQYPPDRGGMSSSLPRSASFASLAFPSHLSLPKTKLPAFPSFPNVPMAAIGSVRGFSASAKDDKSLWKTWWEGSGATAEEMKKDEKAREHAHKHMLDDADKGQTIEEESEHIKQKYATPKNPIVFCHGLLGFDYIGPKGLPALQISHWRGICNVLQENGVELMIAKVPATSSAAQRAEILRDAIEETFPGREVNLVGHSMGGLDGRYLISKLKPTSFKVLSLTTIATPHRGSPFADFFIDNIIGRERLPSWLTILDTVSFGAAGDGSAFQALTTRSMALFNQQVPDDPKVKYYSWGASYQPGWFDPLRWSHDSIKAVEGDNDGLVSVESSKWGEFKGVLIGCSHVDLVGWVNHVRFTMEAWAGRPIAFKPATFYLEIADHLAKQGF